jgi:hypothetical protein
MRKIFSVPEPLKWLTIVLWILVSMDSPAFPVNGDSLMRIPVKLNGIQQSDSLWLRISASGNQVEARQFMQMIGGVLYPISHVFHQDGLMVQYGRYISFTRLGFDQGFVNLQMVQIVPPAILIEAGGIPRYFTPLDFLAQAVNGTVTYDGLAGLLEIAVSPPPGFGSVFPPAANVAQALVDSGFTIRQGEITQEDLIDFCLAGYTPNANGNNVGVPYLGMQIPPSPLMDSLFSVPINFNFNADEAMILIGQTPPECMYYSYRSYLMNRFYNFPPSATRTKIDASLGDMTSLYRMRPDLPVDSMFGRKFALIMAGDSLIATRLKNIILLATPAIADADIYFDILPSEDMFLFGLDPMADWGMFVHRISLFKDSTAQQNFVNHPPLEIIRVTPNQPVQQNLFSLRSFLPRTCGMNEFALLPDLVQLEDGIYNAFHENYEMIWLKPSPWVIEGFVAIQQGMDALGDNHDALYINTSTFQFRENDIVLVYGVDHTQTGQAVYTNASIYGSKYMTGYGGITNTMMEESARQFVEDSTMADRLFAYCFARHPVPGNPFVYLVPSDTNGNLEGINVNDTAQMGFRLYVNSLTKIGPDPMEVILDQAVLLRPLSPGISENANGEKDQVLKVYPNPVSDKATLEITVYDWSDISLTFCHSSGQQIGSALEIGHIRGTVLKQIQVPGNLAPGIYYMRAVIRETGTQKTSVAAIPVVVIGKYGH